MTAPAPSARERIDDIEALRALAILCVLVQHSVWNLVFDVPWLGWLLRYVPLWCGVDLFFVVSGFVITRGLYPALCGGAADPRAVLRRFWMRRAFRLWPAAWSWLALIVAGSLVFRNPPFMGTFALNVWGALAGVLAFADLRFGLNGLGKPYGASFAYWSLSLEEQFYMLLPPLMLLAGRRLVWLAATLLVVQLPLAHPRVYFFLRTDGLLWGVVLASSPVLLRLGRAAAARLASVPLAGAGVLVVALAGMSQASPSFEQAPPFALGALAAAAALPVWLASANRGLFQAGWCQPVVLWLGSRSYALYLCHLPLFQCAAALSHRWQLLAWMFGDHVELRSTVIGVPLLAAAAEATYRLVEVPWRRRGTLLASAAG